MSAIMFKGGHDAWERAKNDARERLVARDAEFGTDFVASRLDAMRDRMFRNNDIEPAVRAQAGRPARQR